MRPLSNLPSELQTDETLQRLLAIAAQYEPESGPPGGLVADALEKASRQSPARRPKAMLGWAAAVGVLGLLAAHRVVLWPTSSKPTTTARQPAAEPIRAPSPNAAATAPAPERSLASRNRTPERQFGIVQSVRGPSRPPAPRRLRTARQSPNPRIRLKIETVHRYHAGVLAPAVIAEHDETTGHETLIPAIVNLPVEIPADESAAAGFLQVRPASHEP